MMSSQIVPQGYKQTKVGVIPEEWEVVKLGEIITLLTDYHANGAYEKLKENVELLSSENYAIMIRTTNFEKNNFVDNLIYVREDAYNYLKKSKVYENDIIINKIANAGATYLMPKLKKPVSLAMNLFLLRLNNKVHEKFIYIQIKQREQYLRILASGTTTKTITKKDVRGFKIPLPPLKVQQKIAQILTTWDDAISKQEALIKAKEELKKGLMQRLLSGEVRFSGFDGEWEEVRLEDLCNITRGASPRPIKKYMTNDVNGVNWLKIGDIDKEAKYITKTKENITLEGSHKSRKIEPNDFILSNSMSFGRPYISKISACIHDGWLLLRNKNKKMLLDTYLYEILSSNLIKKQFLMMAAGSGVKNLKSETVRGTRIPLPTIEEQQKIAQILTLSDKEIDLLKDELDALKEQKRGLMQGLLSGGVRVMI